MFAKIVISLFSKRRRYCKIHVKILFCLLGSLNKYIAKNNLITIRFAEIFIVTYIRRLQVNAEKKGEKKEPENVHYVHQVLKERSTRQRRKIACEESLLSARGAREVGVLLTSKGQCAERPLFWGYKAKWINVALTPTPSTPSPSTLPLPPPRFIWGQGGRGQLGLKES